MAIKNILARLSGSILNPQKPLWIILSLLLMGGTLWLSGRGGSNSEVLGDAKAAPVSLDTFVPEGFVLVTLQLINAESIDSMVGPYSLVDLYAVQPVGESYATKSHTPRRPLASHLKLVRAPNNPSLFGVLVSENEPELIHSLAAPVFAVIQGPHAKPDNFDPTKLKKKNPPARTIRFGDIL